MGILSSTLKDETGSVLIVALMIVVLLTIIGISASTTSTIDIQIAGNEKLYKIAFYAADGGTELAHELLEENICCPTGFSNSIINGEIAIEGDDDINDSPIPLAFWQNETLSGSVDDVDDTLRHAYFPSGYTGSDPHTNLTFNGNTQLSTGSALQMAAGYEGKGKGTAGAGGYILYDIYSQHKGRGGSESTVTIQWRHMIGQEGSCNY
jgi:hypothetical protein